MSIIQQPGRAILLMSLCSFSGTLLAATHYYVDAVNGSNYWTGKASECNGRSKTVTQDGPRLTLSKINILELLI